MTKFLSRPFIIVCITLLIPTNAQKANITDPPRATNVSLNGIIELNCTAVANTFFWRENGQQLDNGINGVDITTVVVDGAQNIRMSTLRVPATDSAAANYTCTAVSNNPFTNDVSGPVVVRKQGPLESVRNLTVTINSTTLFISWSPPSTLKGVPILNNTIIITNTTSGENETILKIENTTMPYYVFSIDHPDPDNNFTVTVIPINGAGPGEPASEMVQLVFPTPTSASSFLSTRPGTSLSFPPSSSSNNASSISTSAQETTTPKPERFNLYTLRNVLIAVGILLALIIFVVSCIIWKTQRCTRRLNVEAGELLDVGLELQDIVEGGVSQLPSGLAGWLHVPTEELSNAARKLSAYTLSRDVRPSQSSSRVYKQAIIGNGPHGSTPGGRALLEPSSKIAITSFTSSDYVTKESLSKGEVVTDDKKYHQPSEDLARVKSDLPEHSKFIGISSQSGDHHQKEFQAITPEKEYETVPESDSAQKGKSAFSEKRISSRSPPSRREDRKSDPMLNRSQVDLPFLPFRDDTNIPSRPGTPQSCVIKESAALKSD